MGRRSRYQRSSYTGADFARRHLDEAAAFSREIGGNDKDVKAYFFSLPANELNVILRNYGVKFGAQAEDYARKTFHAWRTGERGMSGLVASRLFSFLPHHMPLSKKYELAENIWVHFGPSSRHYYTIGTSANVNALASIIAVKLDSIVTAYNIPENIKNRFKWLADGDISVEEQLWNYFRNLQKSLAINKVQLEIPVLQRQVHNHTDKTRLVRSELHIHKHIISISVNKNFAEKIEETQHQYVSSSSGCYIATSVYGSHDSPQVLKLRNYRDGVLSKSWHGRAIIRFYYAVSPAMVKWFGGTAWFKRLFRSWIEHFTERLS